MEAIKNNCKVEWVDLGEGFDGDYNPDDPDDRALLRFDVYGRIDGEWLPVDDASYCTQVEVDTPDGEKLDLLREILSAVEARVNDEIEVIGNRHGIDFIGELRVPGIKRVCEELSWITNEACE